ncbi:MAG: hypothetical protein LBU32_25955 [Clostridiales bacterium]|jgi:hypothetical protein|nr:hypothetical protein [Clostridiales bacterium]
MNGRRFKFIMLILAFTLLPTFCAWASDGEAKSDFSAAGAYDYPAALKTEEWTALDAQDAKLSVCQMPEGILKPMPADALAETVLSCPPLVGMPACNTDKQGFDAVYSQFSGLRELTYRIDAAAKI